MAYQLITRPDKHLRLIDDDRGRRGSLLWSALLLLALLIGGAATAAAIDARLTAGRESRVAGTLERNPGSLDVADGITGAAIAAAHPQADATAAITATATLTPTSTPVGTPTASATRAGVIIIPPDTATPTVTPTITETPGGSAPGDTPTAPTVPSVATVSLVTDTPTPPPSAPTSTPSATLPAATPVPTATPTPTPTPTLTPTPSDTPVSDAPPSILTPVSPDAATSTATATVTATPSEQIPPSILTPVDTPPPSILTPVLSPTVPSVATVSLVTNTPTPTLVVLPPTDTPTLTPSPTATLTPTPTPTATDLSTLVITATHLYSGPGIQFAIVAPVQRGDVIVVVGQTLEGDWYLLDTGYWIQASLVGNAPIDPVVVTPQAQARTVSGAASVVSGGIGGAYALHDANLRAGPGTEYAVLGYAKAGEPLNIVSQSAAGDWYLLDNGCWIAAFLVGNALPGLVTGGAQTASVVGGVSAVSVAPARQFVAVVFSAANLYTGPGVQYPVATRAQQGQLVALVAQTFDGNWYLLGSGYWIASFLVDIVPPEGVLIAPIAPPTLPPPRAIELPIVAPTPTFTPIPAQVAPVLTPVEQEYVADLRAILDGYELALAQIEAQMTSANQNPALILDSEWLTQSGAAIDLLEAQNLAARELTAPPRYTNVQAEILIAAGQFDEAALLLTRAVEELDPNQVPQAIAALEAGNASLERVEALLPVIAAQSPSAPTPVPTLIPTATPSLQPSPQTCDPSYPNVCVPPPPPQLNCVDIPFRNFTVTGADPHGFDNDRDGIGCETG